MPVEIDIRESSADDQGALEDLYPKAFPDEDLVPLVRDLLSEKGGVLSLVAVNKGAVVGHIAFTVCGIAGEHMRIGLLAPLAVAPRFQKQGIGSALTREGLERMKGEGVTRIQVLGDLAYYRRFGFEPDDSVKPPYDLPTDWQTAWQSINLDDATQAFEGRLSVPKPWRQPALWGP